MNNILDMKPTVDHPETGLGRNQMLAANLSACLADSYVLMIKTQAYHWNAVGPLFHPIHLLTEEHYENLFKAIDEIAERIRALGHPAPSSMTDLVGLSGLSEDTGNPATEEMVHNLAGDHETAARRFRKSIELAEDANDFATADLLTERIAFHEKANWMLRSILAK